MSESKNIGGILLDDDLLDTISGGGGKKSDPDHDSEGYRIYHYCLSNKSHTNIQRTGKLDWKCLECGHTWMGPRPH